MSSKENFISQLHKAGYEHKKWLNSIKVLVSGISTDKDSIPLNEMETPFGRWLYHDAMVFSTQSSKSVLEEISKLYTECYESYLKIYGVMFSGKSEGFLSGLFSNKKASNSEILLAQKYYEELVKVSDNLIRRMRTFENQMYATSNEKFDHLCPQEDTAPVQNTSAETASVPGKGQRYYRGSLIEE
jgi:hypothetical protein